MNNPTPSGSPDNSEDDRPTEENPIDWLTPEPVPEKEVRDTLFTLRFKPEERARVDQAAAALGLSTSAYVRSQLLSARRDLAAWRGVYQIILSSVEDAKADGLPPETLEVLRKIQNGFESIAATIFAQPGEDE